MTRPADFLLPKRALEVNEKIVNFNALELQLPQNLMFSRALDLKFPGIPALNLWWI